jgi:mRNA interferase YafQ
MDESRAMMTNRRAHFATSNALFAHLEKTAASKRASLPRAAEYTKVFPKDWQRLTHSGRHDMVQLKKAMLLIANDAPLGPEWLGRALKGDWVDHRDCRIGRDFPLIYQVAGRLQTPQKKSVEIFTADPLASHRYAGQGSPIRGGLERRQSRAGGWAIARRKHD